MEVAAFLFILFILHGRSVIGQDVITISGESKASLGGKEPTAEAPIDVSGAIGGGRESGSLPNDGLLPKFCASPVGKKCAVKYDLGVLDEDDENTCMYKCQLVSCLSVQFEEGKCQLSSKRCEKLVNGKGTNYYRLKKGESQCPKGTGPVGVDQVTLQNSYCQGNDVECPGPDIAPPHFSPTLHQCSTDCNVNVACLTAHFSKDKICHLRGNRCTNSELVAAPGAIDLYRRMKGETCPTDRPPFVLVKVSYSGKFCMIEGKSCPGHDLYDKPQNLNPLEQCLIKCARILSCGSVDFFNNLCSPKDKQCEDSELVSKKGSVNLIRLLDGEQCPLNRSPPPTNKPWSGRFCVKKSRECVGNDMEGMPVKSADITTCLTKCVNADGCATVYYSEGSCSLKNNNCEESDLKSSEGDTYYRLRAGEACPEPESLPSCAPHSSYRPDAPACPNTCENRHADTSCKVESIQACACDAGYVKAADTDDCIPISECGCTDVGGNKHQVGDIWRSTDCKVIFTCQLNAAEEPEVHSEEAECGVNQQCNDGECKCTLGYKMVDKECQPAVECGPHSSFDPAAPATPNICHNPARAVTNSDTIPGCPCNPGYILNEDGDGGQCVAYSDCGCKDETGKLFVTGDTWLSDDCTKSRSCEQEAGSLPAIVDTSFTCTKHSTCTAADGSGKCTCDDGYTSQLDTCKPGLECEKPTSYKPKGSLCPNTCAIPNKSSTCTDKGPTCVCPSGQVLSDDNKCVEPTTCPCYDETGKARLVGDKWLTVDCGAWETCSGTDQTPVINSTKYSCMENAKCDTASGFSQCVCEETFIRTFDGERCVPEKPPCEDEIRKRVASFVDDILHVISGGCGSCSDTCQNPHASRDCPITSRLCHCSQPDQLFDQILGRCIPADECGCYDTDGNPVMGGASWLTNDCESSRRCSDEGGGAPKIVTSSYTCTRCNGQGVCLDPESESE